MIPPNEMGAFQFIAVASLRVGQLLRGCVPRVEGNHAMHVIAQREVAEGKVTALADQSIAVPESPA